MSLRVLDLGRSLVMAQKTDFSDSERKDLAKSGAAMSDGSFPIRNGEDLHHAISLMGMSNHPEGEVKSHILNRAKALGLAGELPDSWKTKKYEAGLCFVTRTTTLKGELVGDFEVEGDGLLSAKDIKAVVDSKVQKGGPGSGPHPGKERGEAAYKQTAVAQAATARANAGAKDSETPDKGLERSAAKEHMVAEAMHDAAASAYQSEGNATMASQHQAAAEEHSKFASGHKDSAKKGDFGGVAFHAIATQRSYNSFQDRDFNPLTGARKSAMPGNRFQSDPDTTDTMEEDPSVDSLKKPGQYSNRVGTTTGPTMDATNIRNSLNSLGSVSH